MELHVEGFRLRFDGIPHSTFECRDYRGVIFYKDDFKYEVIHSALGVRLLINHETWLGFFRDLPFHEGTWRFLPEEVQVDMLPSSSG